METRIFFFNENSKKSTINRVLGKSSNEIKEHIETISKMRSGRKIGYFQFQYKETYYKFYIMPKIYRVEEQECNDCTKYQEKFISFFKHYYRLVGKYDIDKYSDELDGNISDLSYKSEDNARELANSDTIDDFIVHNYNDSLLVIESFFTKHKKEILKEQKFQSQSIQSQIDIRRNIVEPNQSNIHQTKKVPMIYSNIAVIAMEVLNYFVNTKIKNFSETTKSIELKRKANKIRNSLKQKFPNSYDLNFKIKEILLRKISKLFDKNNEYKLVYKSLLKLTGKEHYYNGDVYREIQKEDEMVSLFFQPEKLYEWILYDELVTNKIFDYDEVLKDGKDDVKLPFELVPAYDSKKTYSSEPDLVIVKDGKKYPVDAKWKILKTKNSAFDNDIAKLRRDAKIRGVNKGYLIYPKIDEDSKFKLNTEYKYDFDDFVFELRVVNVM